MRAFINKKIKLLYADENKEKLLVYIKTKSDE